MHHAQPSLQRPGRFPRARTILSATSGLSALKLLLPAMASSRAATRTAALTVMKWLSDGKNVAYSYRVAGQPLTGLLRLSDLFSDFQSALELAAGDCYHLEQLPEPEVIIDAGANTGLFSLACAARWPAARITAFEPVPSNIEAIGAHLNANGLAERVTLVPRALGASHGEVTFYLRDANQGSMSADIDYDDKLQVQIVPITEYVPAKVDGVTLMKFDIEGAEMDCLPALFERGPMERTIIVMELHEIAQNLAPVREMASRAGMRAEIYEMGSTTCHMRISTPDLDLPPLPAVA